jgi:acyl-CoA synthetase (NDP forming)
MTVLDKPGLSTAPARSGAAGGFIDVSKILEPRSVAVIGASDRAGNFGGATVQRLVRFGFKGPVWPVNRSGAAVAGVPGFTSVAALPGVPDLAVFAIPAESLLESIKECAARGTRAGIAYAGGFQDGVLDEIAAFCRETGFALCGPNCVGVINTALPATPTFSTALEDVKVLPAGAISMVSQSGGIGTTALTMSMAAGFPFRHFVSGGNETVVDFADYLYAAAHDPGTKVIAGYLEGVNTSGEKFVAALEAARDHGKPVVMIKAGTTGDSARAALAHTGALVGEDRVFDAVIRELGVTRAYSVEELVDVAALLVGTRAGMPFGPGVGIMTFGGGNGVLATDQCAQNGLKTPPLTQACVDKLKPLLASVATAANPVDLTPTTAFRDEFLANLPSVLDVVAAEKEIDVLLFIIGTLAARANEIIAAIAEFARRSPKPLCVSWPSPPDGVREKLAAHGIYMFAEPANAVRALSRLADRGRQVPRLLGKRAALSSGFGWQSFVPSPRDGMVVSEHECHAIMGAAGLPVAAGGLAADEAQAAAIAEKVGFPVAMKGISDAITHRAAAGLVTLNVRNGAEAKAAARQLFERGRELKAELDGVYVQKMEAGKTELLVSASRDPMFGTMVSCGGGGVMTELIGDVVTRRAPVTIDAAKSMLEALRLRGHAKDSSGVLPLDDAAAFIAQFSELAAAAPWQKFMLEANPVKWTREGAVAVDGLLIIEKA